MRSLLYCPGNTPSMLTQAGIYGSDAIVFDLEDAVAPEQKDEARVLCGAYLASFDYGDTSCIVRINGLDTDLWLADLSAVVPSARVIVRIPKVEQPRQVEQVCEALERIESEYALPAGSTKLHLLLETPQGIEQAFVLAGSSPRVTALAFGAEDYCSATGIRRYGEPFALDYVRSRLVSAAGAYGIACFDTVWGMLSDHEGLQREAERSRALGCSGKSVIHPDQVAIVNAVFSATIEEIDQARRILERADTALSQLDGRMIDAPVLSQARRILAKAENGSQEGKR
ncbi:MAG: CoA ester lyase [Spirochaetia bacterium]|nr:CoA ester lyase [Spirochaetia bacterium]